jgi:rubrerythrin
MAGTPLAKPSCEEQVLAMQSVEIFLAHAIRLEQEAALRFAQLADAMETSGNAQVGKLFRCLAEYSRMHLADAHARAGFREIPQLQESEYQWPNIESPETAAIWAADPFIGREQALKIALDAESAGLAYYQSIRDSTTDPEVKRFATEFVEEETQHVAELTRWLALQHAGLPLPTDYTGLQHAPTQGLTGGANHRG